jgi:hypothetical protein
MYDQLGRKHKKSQRILPKTVTHLHCGVYISFINFQNCGMSSILFFLSILLPKCLHNTQQKYNLFYLRLHPLTARLWRLVKKLWIRHTAKNYHSQLKCSVSDKADKTMTWNYKFVMWIFWAHDVLFVTEHWCHKKKFTVRTTQVKRALFLLLNSFPAVNYAFRNSVYGVPLFSVRSFLYACI